MHDYHVHTNYSDGDFMSRMIAAGERAGLEGIGFADHCNVFQTDRARAYRARYGFNLDLTYDRRQSAIEDYRERTNLRLYDAVEMDYEPDQEAALGSYLDDKDFDYVIGSVHAIDGVNVHDEAYFSEFSDSDRHEMVAEYVEKLFELIESALFDVTAHLDLPERNPALRGYLDEDDYHQIADALSRSTTVPELNAGRVLDAYGEFHPRESFADILLAEGVEFTIGSDAHAPDELTGAVTELQSIIDEWGVPVVELDL